MKQLLFLMLVFLSAGAVAGEQISRKMYNPWEADSGYSQVVKAGNTLYISGVASNKPTLEEQVIEAYAFIEKILGDYGLPMESIVKQVIFTTDIEAFKKLGKIRTALFKDQQYPASSLAEVSRLHSPQHKVEIEVIAFIEDQ